MSTREELIREEYGTLPKGLTLRILPRNAHKTKPVVERFTPRGTPGGTPATSDDVADDA